MGLHGAFVKIDLHVHTATWSDGHQSAEATVEAAIACGLDGLVITDHDRMLRSTERAELQARYPDIQIFRGAELSCVGPDHVNVIGGLIEELPSRRSPWTAAELGALLAGSRSFSILNHPFWMKPSFALDFDDFCPDAVEILSANGDDGRVERALELVVERGLLITASSDAHEADQLGMFCVECDEKVVGDEALVDVLRAGRYRLSCIASAYARRVAEIVQEEAIYRRCLADGGDESRFRELGGQFIWSRYQAGGSYMPNAAFLGLRGDHYVT